jgi:hypothetical protein
MRSFPRTAVLQMPVFAMCSGVGCRFWKKRGGRGAGSANEDGERRKRTELCCRQTATQKRVQGDLREEGSRVRDNKSTIR